MQEGTIEKVIDLRGQICPSTLLIALREVNQSKSELKAGSLALVYLSDNRSSTTHITDAVGSMGYTVTVEKDQGYYRIRICGCAV